jgi:hypothetical protein
MRRDVREGFQRRFNVLFREFRQALESEQMDVLNKIGQVVEEAKKKVSPEPVVQSGGINRMEPESTPAPKRSTAASKKVATVTSKDVPS